MRVRIRPLRECMAINNFHQDDTLCLIPPMKKYCGRVIEIDPHAYHGDEWLVQWSDERWLWHIAFIEPDSLDQLPECREKSLRYWRGSKCF